MAIIKYPNQSGVIFEVGITNMGQTLNMNKIISSSGKSGCLKGVIIEIPFDEQ